MTEERRADERIAQIISSHLGLEDDSSGNPIITGINAAAHEIAALYDRALKESEELIDNLFDELEDFPPPAAERDRAIQEAIDALIYAYAGVSSVTADRVKAKIIPALRATAPSPAEGGEK